MKYIFLLCVAVALISCNGTLSRVDRVRLEPVMIADTLFSNFIGAMEVYGDYIILLNPFMKSGFLAIYDRYTGKELNAIGTFGKGPGEYISPHIGNLYNDELLLYDLNAGKKASIVVDSLIGPKDNPIHLTDLPDSDIAKIIKIDSNFYVVATYYNEPPLELYNGTSIIGSFGKPPISGTSEFPQGLIKYHPAERLLVYAPFDNPYLACYRRETDNSFTLKWENQFIEPRYSIQNNEIHWDAEQDKGILDFSFTKSYIVCVKNELKLREIQGRDSATSPRCLYLFDYEGKLVKIVELAAPSTRIASEINSDMVYLVSLEPDFCIVKYDLSDI